MEHETYRVEQKCHLYCRSRKAWISEYTRCNGRAVTKFVVSDVFMLVMQLYARMANENDINPMMRRQNLLDLMPRFSGTQSGRTDATRYRHDLDGDDPNISVIRTSVFGVELNQKIYVSVQPNTNAMDKQYR